MDKYEHNGFITVRTAKCSRCKKLKKYGDCYDLCKKLPKVADDDMEGTARLEIIMNFALDTAIKYKALPCFCECQRYQGLTDAQLRFLNGFEKIPKDFLCVLLETFRRWPEIDPEVVFGALCKDTTAVEPRERETGTSELIYRSEN